MFGLEISLPPIVLGAITGLTYGLLSAGIVLVYRTNRVINFAHGEMGAFGAALFGLLSDRAGVPYYLNLPIALLAGAGIAALAEVAVIRRLRKAPKLMSVVATLGVAQLLTVLALVVNGQAGAGLIFPEPPGLPVFEVGALRVTPSYTGILFFAPLVVVALAIFLRRSRFGLALRASAANAEAARMAGVFAVRMSTLAWGLAGALSTFTAILVLPTVGLATGASFGPGLLLRALVGAVLARMSSLPGALAAGLGLGILEGLLFANYSRGGVIEVVLFVVIIVALLVRSPEGGRDDDKGQAWSAVQPWRALPEKVSALPSVRRLPTALGLGLLAAFALLPLVTSNNTAIKLTSILGFAMVALSVGVLTGLGGQLTLGQFAMGAVGATVSYQVTTRTGGNVPLGLLYGGLAGAAVSALIGLPALRIRGLFLAVTTLSFALIMPTWALAQPWALGDGADPGQPVFFGMTLDSGRRYYWFALAAFVVLFMIARNIRRSGFGRLLIAIRDNEDNARAFTIDARRVKLQGFLLAGFIAGVGGGVYGHAFSSIQPSTFITQFNIDIVVMTVVGGVSILSGPLLGAAFVLGVPAFLPLDSAGLAATRFGLLLVILYAPGGIAQLLAPLRKLVIDRIARRAGVDPTEDPIDQEVDADRNAVPTGTGREAPSARQNGNGSAASERRLHRLRSLAGVEQPLLSAYNLRKRYGGLTALNNVSLEVIDGETLGLIGPNGAGKTTLFEVLGGFNRPDEGRITFEGDDITALGPEGRGRLGLIRSFQDAALFPTMTVTETVQLSMERTSPTGLLASVVGLPGTERAKFARARELVGEMGLWSYRNKQVQELSTGTRRITELACLVALEPRLLLLDEPSSGIAQRETEALGGLLQRLKAELDMTLVIIEHDIPLIMGLADRIVAMDTGRVIASGSPAEVRNDPAVVESYLGGKVEAIERSGVVEPKAKPKPREKAKAKA
jgi:ABC-type branched-subunit amino acid transport system ATPase component/ABC-type branched-subunit amino acid transport system permease subunit